MMIRIPTGIEFFDKQIEGGLYPSMIFLIEEVGAGGREFALTSVCKNARAKEYPREVLYISISSSPDEVVRDISLAFPQARLEDVLNSIKIKSLAELYFGKSIIPLSWITDKKPSLKSLKEREKDPLSELVRVCDEVKEGSLVFLDSLSDLVRLTRARISWNDLIDLMKGLRKLCIKKNLLLISLLTKGMLERSFEEELLDQADCVLVFEWEVEKEAINRWMYIRKLVGILPILEKDKIAKYSVRIDPVEGFTVSRFVRSIMR
jgi:KaiC/GvpD/RAD55 family RecA-like ATPase